MGCDQTAMDWLTCHFFSISHIYFGKMWVSRSIRDVSAVPSVIKRGIKLVVCIYVGTAHELSKG
jgi:hypothetical protein